VKNISTFLTIVGRIIFIVFVTTDSIVMLTDFKKRINEVEEVIVQLNF
jgi:hypothetical protein